MSAGAAAGFPGFGQFGGRFGRHFIRSMNGKTAQIVGPDGNVSEVPADHMPAGSTPGAYLNEPAFMQGHRQRALAAAQPFVQALAQRGGAPAAVAPGQAAPALPPPPASVAPSAVAASPLPAVVSPVQATPAAAPPPPPTGLPWGDPQMLDYIRQYGGPAAGLSQEQADLLIGKAPVGPSAETIAYNKAQQQFTANNQLYGATGYQGNANQVASQVAGGAQSAGIPMGVLGTSFYRGGADFGGQQNAGNSLNGNNGAVNWNDPSVANYGVSDAAYIPALAATLLNAKTALNSTPTTTAQVGKFVTDVGTQLQAQERQQAQQSYIQQLAGSSAPMPAQAIAQPVMSAVTPATVNPGGQVAGPASTAAVSYAPQRQTIQPTTQTATTAPTVTQNAQQSQGSVTGGGYTPGVPATQTKLVGGTNADAAEQQRQQQVADFKAQVAGMSNNKPQTFTGNLAGANSGGKFTAPVVGSKF